MSGISCSLIYYPLSYLYTTICFTMGYKNKIKINCRCFQAENSFLGKIHRKKGRFLENVTYFGTNQAKKGKI